MPDGDAAGRSAAADALELAGTPSTSEVVVSVPQGSYTAEVTRPRGAGGLVRTEIREIAHGATRLVNVSTRGYVGRGANRITIAFSVEGSGAEPLLARAVGPGLAPFGVAGILPRPTLELAGVPPGVRPDVTWRTSQTERDFSASASLVGAFPLAADGADRSAIVSVRPGTYTMRVGGAEGATGVALAELFELPEKGPR